MEDQFTRELQVKLVRPVFIFILCTLAFRYYNHVLLHQLLQPVIYKTESDLAYWVYHILGVGKIIVQNRLGGLLFDSLLVSLCLTSIAYPSQRVTVIAFSVVYPLYFLSYNAFVTHHTGTMDGILLINFAFWAVKPSTFKLTWEALRYYNLAIYSMAFFWKIFIGGSVFHLAQSEAIVKENLVLYLYLNPETSFAHVIHWFLRHPVVLYFGYSFCIGIQGFMILGFFTRRYDRLLCLLTVMFHVATYFFVDVCYFELLILNFTFLRSADVKRFATWLENRYLPVPKNALSPK